MTTNMSPEQRSQVSEVTRVMTSLVKGHGFQSEKTRYWIAPQQLVQWELQMVMEPGYGPGVFRLEWGVRAPRVAELEGLENLSGAMHATIGGDVGSLAMRRHKMTFLCVEGGKVAVLTSLLWGLRPEPKERLSGRIDDWITSHLLPLLGSLDTYESLASFLETYQTRYGKVFLYPAFDGQRLRKIAVLRALAGDRPAAEQALSEWKALLGKPGAPSYANLIKGYDQVASRLRRL